MRTAYSNISPFGVPRHLPGALPGEVGKEKGRGKESFSNGSRQGNFTRQHCLASTSHQQGQRIPRRLPFLPNEIKFGCQVSRDIIECVAIIQVCILTFSMLSHLESDNVASYSHSHKHTWLRL